MNRIILIGNGFDLAHELPTKYTDFMDWYWTEFGKKIYAEDNGNCILKPHSDPFTIATVANSRGEYSSTRSVFEQGEQLNSFAAIKNIMGRYRLYGYADVGIDFSFKNKFFGYLSDKTCLQTWLDIESEYYILLKDFLKENRLYAHLWPTVKDLNDEFGQVKKLLEKYLTEVCIKDVVKIESIEKALASMIDLDEIAQTLTKSTLNHILHTINLDDFTIPMDIDQTIKEDDDLSIYYTKEDARHKVLRDMILSEKLNKYTKPQDTIFLNFNYTNTAEKLYKRADDVVINIHGELNNQANRMIFGYGDELDEDYRAIERTGKNDFLENIKSIQYHNTGNYRLLLGFLEDEPYQVFVMGHSCGNSDRTLLNTIFEHENCISVKPFYWDKGNNENDYTQLVMNISRNFSNKQNLRDIVVSKERCQSLVPCEK